MSRIYKLTTAIKAHQGKKALGRALSVSVVNQMVSSGTNFALGIYLVRTLPPAEFGLYGIGFAISLFYAGIGNALFLMQMIVHTPGKEPEDRIPYAGRMLLLVSVFCAVTVLLATLMFLAGSAVWKTLVRHADFVIAVMAASIAYLLKEFFVRHAYNVRREVWALAIHGTILCTIVTLVWTQHRFITSFNVEMALGIYAAAQVSGVLLGCILAKLPFPIHQRGVLLGDLREAWDGGKWASITNLVYFARTQAHTIAVASLLGPVGVAKLNAARLFVTPALMLTPALSQVAMPRMVATREQSESNVIRIGFLFSFVMLGIALLYSSIMLGGYDFVVDMVLGEKYQDLFVIIALWCLYACLLALRNGADMLGQVLKKFRILSIANTYSAIVCLLVTYGLTVSFGLTGTLIGLMVGEIVLVVLLFYLLLVAGSINKSLLSRGSN